MTWVNYDDALRQVQAAGLDVAHIEVDTPRPVRCREVNGDHEKRGWYWLHGARLEWPKGSGQYQDFVVGSYGIFRGTDHGKQAIRLSAHGVVMDEQTRAALKARHAESVRIAAAQRAAQHEKAARRAAECWARYLPVQPGDALPDYLRRKGVKAYGLRHSPSGNGTLAVPMCDVAGRVQGLQLIRGKDRGRKLEKEYWPRGLRKSGHFHMTGTPGAVILLVEGYATGATVFEATGLCTVMAFDANNLMPVAQVLHKAYPGAHILVCADDDYLTANNPGETCARNAALAVRGSVVVPVFPSDRKGRKLTDFNDLANVPDGGLQRVRVQIEAALTRAGLMPRLSAQPVHLNGADGTALDPAQGEGERQAQALMKLEELIERFVPIDDGTGEFVFDHWTRKIARKSQMLALLPAGVRGDDIKRHPLWEQRGAYFIDQIGFDPSERDPTVKANTWRGWQMTPRAEGSCEKLLDLLFWLCSQEENPGEVYNWLLKWMAYPLQHPGAKMMSAVIMHGPQGTGKSTVFQALGKIYGDYSRIINQRALEDKFNSDWVDSTLYMLAEEVIARQEMWHIKNELKELVTGEWVRVNPKNLPAYRRRNQINIVYLSNETQPLPLENDDRRHLVVYTPPVQSREVYQAVYDEIINGGLERFYYHLLHEVDTSDFAPHSRPPMTQSKQDLIDISLPSEATFIKRWQEGEIEFGGEQLPFCPCTGRQLFTAYRRWAAESGILRPRDEIQFIGYVRRLPGWIAGKTAATLVDLRGTAYKNRKMVIPGDDAFAKAQAAGTCTINAEDKPRTRWLTECFFAFANALEIKS